MYSFWNLSRFALFVLWRSIQSQFKTIQPQLKVKGKKRKKYSWAKKVVFYCKCSFQFIIANARACKGVPFVDLFFAIFKKGFKKKTTVLTKCIFLELVKVCFVCALEEHPITIQKRSTTIQNKGNELFWRR